MRKILVVEDDPSIRELLIDVLECQGYEVTSSINGFEGIKSLYKTIPDIILTDIMMPVMDGYAFRKELLFNPNWSSIPIIAMSAQNQNKEKLADYGIKNFINKPFELDHLLETVKNIN